MRSKIVRLFIYLGINILFLLKLFLISTFLTSPLFSIVMLAINGLYKTQVCVLIWVALNTVLTIVFCVRTFCKIHKMKRK